MRGFDDTRARRIFIWIAVVLLLGALINATRRSEPDAVHSADVIAVDRVQGSRSVGGSRGIVTVRLDDSSVATIDVGRYAVPRVGDQVRVERRSDLLRRRHLRIVVE